MTRITIPPPTNRTLTRPGWTIKNPIKAEQTTLFEDDIGLFETLKNKIKKWQSDNSNRKILNCQFITEYNKDKKKFLRGCRIRYTS